MCVYSRKHKERHTDSRMSVESADSGDHHQQQQVQQQQQQQQTPHLLQPDPGLWTHIEYAKKELQPLTTVTEQVKQAAMLVKSMHVS